VLPPVPYPDMRLEQSGGVKLWGQRSLVLWTVIKPRGKMATASIKAVRELGSDGMANICALRLNVVRKYKPKMLRGLSQKGTVDR
jgi:hypothetical protein